MEAQNKNENKLIFCGSIDYDEEKRTTVAYGDM
jgi:hypothetical protein